MCCGISICPASNPILFPMLCRPQVPPQAAKIDSIFMNKRVVIVVAVCNSYR